MSRVKWAVLRTSLGEVKLGTAATFGDSDLSESTKTKEESL